MSERRSGGGAEGRGTTNISDTVVSKIAGVAAQEIEKVQMGGGTAAAVGGFLTSVTGAVTGGNSTGGGAGLTSGVSVEVGRGGRRPHGSGGVRRIDPADHPGHTR
jgi:uncharacterized alkaline shock family protein YloU